MAVPPVVVGAVNATTASVLPAVTALMVGAPETVPVGVVDTVTVVVAMLVLVTLAVADALVDVVPALVWLVFGSVATALLPPPPQAVKATSASNNGEARGLVGRVMRAILMILVARRCWPA
jgi:hypothetical protein